MLFALISAFIMCLILAPGTPSMVNAASSVKLSNTKFSIEIGKTKTLKVNQEVYP